jgi:S-formylglutathione hydrolase
MKKLESIKEFDGYLERYSHYSECCQCEMVFSIYLPKQAVQEKVPALYWLSGLTCSDDNFRVKAGAQRYASEQGIALIIPDTSPRGEGVMDFPERYDLGIAAGFYVNATESPWDKNYQMYSYIVEELPALIEEHFPVVAGVKSISGHSMGGHGALICALKNPSAYCSVSAFSPICHPTQVPWGKDALGAYLGNDMEKWQQYDAVNLVQNGHKVETILVDQGTADEFLSDQLKPEALIEACEQQKINLNFRMQEGYDHSYHFISSFIGEHIAYHSNFLKKEMGD